jgi:hypothetical protein
VLLNKDQEAARKDNIKIENGLKKTGCGKNELIA